MPAFKSDNFSRLMAEQESTGLSSSTSAPG
jgi:hypothetical protein